MTWSRREFLTVPVALGLAAQLRAETPTPIIDTHTHFYDPTRPQGVPWPGKDDKILYRKVLPEEYAKLVAPHGITGTVVVEASPWIEDNQWLLELAQANPILVAVVGRLLPSSDDFEKNLKRFGSFEKFRGIRLSHDEVKSVLEKERELRHLTQLNDAGMVLDVNGGPDLLTDVARLARKLPKLRIVVNHLANPNIDGKAPPGKWVDGIKAAAESQMVSCKISGLVDSTRKREKSAPKELDFYRPYLEVAFKEFGPDRLMFGSNWPVSDHYASFATLYQLAEEFLKTQGEESKKKILGENALKIYGIKV